MHGSYFLVTITNSENWNIDTYHATTLMQELRVLHRELHIYEEIETEYPLDNPQRVYQCPVFI
jgi:hypothetical protein